MDVLELLLQDGALKLEKDPNTLDFVKGWYSGNGAFRDAEGKPDLYNTAYALRSLRLLFAIHEVDLDKVAEYILSCRNPDGGFSKVPGAPSDIKSTYYGISALHSIGKGIQMEPTGEYILSLLEGDGAIADGKGIKKTRIDNSYYAVYGLASLGHEFLDVEKEAILDYISKQQNKDGGYKRWDMSRLSTITSTTGALLVSYYFNPEVHLEGLGEYVDTLRSEAGGYLSFSGGVNPDIKSTFLALVSLRMMGAPVDPSVREFVLSCKGNNGGFTEMSNEPLPDSKDTYYGLACTCLID